MGAKTTFAAAIDGDPRALLSGAAPEPGPAAELVAAWLPGPAWLPGEPTTLDSGIYPRDGVAALRLPGVDILGAEEVLSWLEPPLPAHLVEAVGDRRLVVHAMHSTSDGLTFALWQAGQLVRAVGMDPESGVSLDLGTPLPAEEPFWRGEHPMDEDYPLPFHPLDLGEELLRAELGFVLEGMPYDGDVDPFEVAMFTFTKPAAPRPAAAPRPVRRGLFGRRR